MRRFTRELRRREIFRALGLYVGISWLVVEASSVVLPAFDAPEWVLRALILVAIAGFPVTAVLAWFFDVTARGISRDTGASGDEPLAIGRKADFVVIGVLAVALTVSIYLNLTRAPEAAVPFQPVSVLIADFDNRTGETIFDGVLEQALNIGIEGAPNVSAYSRSAALELARELNPSTERMTPEAAGVVARRERIAVVLEGTIAAAQGTYALALRGVDPFRGEPKFEVEQRAMSRDEVLAAVGALARSARERLGDTVARDDETAIGEAFTAASLEAARAYVRGSELALDGDHASAIDRFRRATELDPRFGRAYAGWAVSAFTLGRTEQANAAWSQALALMDTMTERERLRTLSTYYIGVTRNYEQAIETLSELVEKYPADAAGRNNLAVTEFLTLDFKAAAEQGTRVLDMFPNEKLYRTNAALYSMYSGDFEGATAVAEALVRADPDAGSAYLPIAIAAMERGDSAAALAAYARMATAKKTQHGASEAALGTADVLLYVGDTDGARKVLNEGIEEDLATGNLRGAAAKQVALAESFLQTRDLERAVSFAQAARSSSRNDAVEIAAALVLVEAGDIEAVSEISGMLTASINDQDRAYALMLEAAVLRGSGQPLDATAKLRAGLGISDLWRIRYELGLAYLDGGYFAEAFEAFDACRARRGEATAMYLDDLPTYRYLAELPYWRARAQEPLGMRSAAREGYATFLRLRPNGGPLADDARERLR